MFQPNVEMDQHTVHNSRISAAKSDRIESQYSSNDRDSELRVARPPKRCTLNWQVYQKNMLASLFQLLSCSNCQVSELMETASQSRYTTERGSNFVLNCEDET
jgi:hypothetical protein